MKANVNKDEYSNEISFNQTEEKPVNNKISGNENKNNTNDKKNIVSKRKYLKLAIIIGIIIIICIIIALIIFFISSKSKKNENFNEIESTSTSINNDEDEILHEKETTSINNDNEDKNIKDKDIIINDINEYSFTATYKTKNGESLKIFNPSRLGLKEGDYFIYESSEDSNLRRLDELEIDDGILNSTKNGITTIKVNFTSQLSNLDFMFEGCENLINVNLSNLNSSINSMIYTFTNCKN